MKTFVQIGSWLGGTLVVVAATACSVRTPSAPAKEGTAPAAGTPAKTADPAQASNNEEINPRLLRRFRPVAGQEGEVQASADKVALGRVLFHDKRLSQGKDIACNTCHKLDNFGIDGKATSSGTRGQPGSRNTPTVFNSASHVAQFWDGRAASVEEQATGPIMNPSEMAMPSEKAVVDVLKAVPQYVKMFAKAFPGDPAPVSLKNIGEAIGAFERGLVTHSRWDKFIAGDVAALTAEEKRGLRVFLEVGCVNCHTGPQVGGTMFQKVGSLVAWPNQKDLGRMGVTKSPADRMVFKVPTLKNIAKTAPYFHDASVTSLEEAVDLMAKHQLGITLEADETKAIAAWMRSMTGDADPAYIAAPAIPGVVATTP